MPRCEGTKACEAGLKRKTENGKLKTFSAPHKANGVSAPIKGGTPAPSNPQKGCALTRLGVQETKTKNTFFNKNTFLINFN